MTSGACGGLALAQVGILTAVWSWFGHISDWLLDNLYIVGLYFNCGRDEAGQFDDEAAFSHAFDRQQAAFILAEDAADDADFFAIHGF